MPLYSAQTISPTDSEKVSLQSSTDWMSVQWQSSWMNTQGKHFQLFRADPSQIAATYGNDAAADALKRSSSYGVFADPYEKDSAYSTGANPALTTATSRAPSTLSTGYNSHSGMTRPQSGVALFDRNRDSYVGTPNSGHFSPALNPGQGGGYMDVDESSRYGTTGTGSDHERERYT